MRKVREVIKTFLNLDLREEDITRMKGGFMNEIYHCKFQQRSAKWQQVIVRFYGKDDIAEPQALSVIGEVGEVVTCYTMGQQGLGPVVYGVFPGGRVEEYIDADRLPHEVIMTRDCSKIMATKLAKVHSLDIPIPKTSTSLVELLDLSYARYMNANQVYSTKRSQVVDDLGFDLLEEMTWLKSLLGQLKSPLFLCHNDLNRSNILLRKNSHGHLDDTDLVLIDFEHCSYNYPAYDIAYYFNNWMYDYSINYPYFSIHREAYPNVEERRYFVETYLKQLQLHLGHQVDMNFETIELQRLFFSVYHHLYLILGCLAPLDDHSNYFGFAEFIAVESELYASEKMAFQKDTLDRFVAHCQSGG